MNMQGGQETIINGVRLDIRERGVGEPVIFVHGAMGDECAAVVVEPVLTNRYRVIDYHRRGYGRSELPDFSVPIAQQTADLKAIMEHMDVPCAHLVGLSYGGVIILQMALDYPDSVQTLSVLEPALPAILFNAPGFKAVGEKAGALYQADDTAGALDVFGREIAGADFRARIDSTLPPGYFERWVADADTVFQSDMAMLPGWQFTAEDAARITQPVLNVVGANTTPYFREIFETLRIWLPQTENFVVPDAAHAILQLNPRGMAKRLVRFLECYPL